MIPVKVAAMDYGLDGMDLDVEDSGAGEEVQVGDDDIDDGEEVQVGAHVHDADDDGGVDDDNDDDDDDKKIV